MSPSYITFKQIRLGGSHISFKSQTYREYKLFQSQDCYFRVGDLVLKYTYPFRTFSSFLISSLIKECLRSLETSTSRFKDIVTYLIPWTFSSTRVLVITSANEFALQSTCFIGGLREWCVWVDSPIILRISSMLTLPATTSGYISSPESVNAPRRGSIVIVFVSKSRLRCPRRVFGLSPVDYRSDLDSGALPLLRGAKARIDGLAPNILVRLSVASRSFLVHRRKVIRPSTFQAI